MQYASVVGRLSQRGSNKPGTHEYHGRVRVAVLDTTFTDTDTVACIARFPAGRIRLLGMSVLQLATEVADNVSIKVGVSAHQNYQRLGVAKNEEALLSATPLKKVLPGIRLQSTGLSGLLVESVQGFDVIMTASEPLPQGTQVTGVIYYVAD